MNESTSSRCWITLQTGERTQVLTDEHLRRYATEIGLQGVAHERYTWTFALDILLNERLYGIEPWAIVGEVRGLEDGLSSMRTREPSRTGERGTPQRPNIRELLRGEWGRWDESDRSVRGSTSPVKFTAPQSRQGGNRRR